jgi:hypothetical protein
MLLREIMKILMRTADHHTEISAGTTTSISYILEKQRVVLVMKKSSAFIVIEGSLSFSQNFYTGPYPEPN